MTALKLLEIKRGWSNLSTNFSLNNSLMIVLHVLTSWVGIQNEDHRQIKPIFLNI